jgi:hypothetical protein
LPNWLTRGFYAVLSWLRNLVSARPEFVVEVPKEIEGLVDGDEFEVDHFEELDKAYGRSSDATAGAASEEGAREHNLALHLPEERTTSRCDNPPTRTGVSQSQQPRPFLSQDPKKSDSPLV